GVLVDSKDPVDIALAVKRVLESGTRAKVIAAGTARVAELSVARSRERYAEVVRSALDAAARPHA
ncbi:MAG: hypothetical protein ACRDJU_10490, partial [Actinomycetota bacterium]